MLNGRIFRSQLQTGMTDCFLYTNWEDKHYLLAYATFWYIHVENEKVCLQQSNDAPDLSRNKSSQTCNNKGLDSDSRGPVQSTFWPNSEIRNYQVNIIKMERGKKRKGTIQSCHSGKYMQSTHTNSCYKFSLFTAI